MARFRLDLPFRLSASESVLSASESELELELSEDELESELR